MPTTKQGRTNRLPNTNASSKVGKGRVPGAGNSKKKDNDTSKRSADTINRLNMYKTKPIRNRDGKIVAGAFMMKDRAGDRDITASTGRIQPDRRWFGNTRVVDPKQLDEFRQAMTAQAADPYSVVLKRKKIPMGLLKDAAEYTAGSQRKEALLEQEPFDRTFGKQRRKRVKLDQLFVTRTAEKKQKLSGEGEAEVVEKPEDGYAALLQTAKQSQDTYEDINARDDLVPWGKDSDLQKTLPTDWRPERKDDLFLKGQSKRIWGEFFKVVDCSDVILHVIDARNVPGTRCTMIERHVEQHASHKHLVFILNKIDLVPNWVAKRWMGELAKSRPTIAFHASLRHAFGKGALISLLRQFGKLHEDRKQISVGVIGYPNVGKSSVINTLISKKSCKVAPIPGETKIWQYVSLFKRISLIDCPGVVVDTAGDTEEDSVLKGVVRAERLANPEEFIDTLLTKVKREHVAAQYKLPKDGEESWKDSVELMEMIARRSGRLLKGGDPCIRSAAVMLINDFQRGRLPHFVSPPELKEDEPNDALATIENISLEKQDLDQIGIEVMGDKVEQEKDDISVDSVDQNHSNRQVKASSLIDDEGSWDM